MATQANLELAQKLYVAYYGRPADAAGLEFWANEIEASGAESVVSTFGNSDEYANRFGDLSNEELVNGIYQQAFNRDADEGGLAFYVEKLESGELDLASIALTIVNNAADDDAQDATVLANKVAAADAFTAAAADEYAGDDAAEYAANFLSTVGETALTAEEIAAAVAGLPEPQEPTEPSVPGETFTLTDGRDNLTGTENDDTFYGDVGQNQNGAVANALSTGDRLDGGAGRDKIEASMINDNEVDGLGNFQAPRPITQNIEEVYIEALENVTLDAARMENVEQYWSDFSRGDMTFTNVNLRGDNLNITNDVTFGMRDVQSRTDFNAFFESQALTREAASNVNSSLLVRIADVSTETPTTPLANVDLNLSFDLGEETVNLEGVRSTDGTYAGLAEALRNELSEAGYEDVNVDLSTVYSEVTVANNTVTLPFDAQEILITDPDGNEFSNVDFTQSAIEPVSDGFLVAGNAQPQDPSSTSSLIESNLVLDNAGRGSIAGDVLIGGGSNSNQGVEQFNVVVDRDSAISSLRTTDGGLQNIVISSMGAAGSLFVGSTQAGLAEIDANAFEGAELSLGATDNGIGSDVVNLELLDASGTSADVTFEGMNFDGTVAALNTGSGDDTITLAQFGQSSPSDASQTRSTINAGNGDNTVTLSGENTSVITAGSGQDTVTGGGVSITANTGGGNDTIYAENTGQKTAAVLSNGSTFDVATTAVPAASLVQFLDGREVQVTLGLPGMDPANSFVDGLEVTTTVEASDGVLTTERDLYEAVANAINEDPVLSKLAEASINSSGDLTVQYLIDGVTVAADQLVEIEVLGEAADLTAGQRTSLRDALRAEYNDSSISNADVDAAYDEAATVSDFAEVVDDGVAAVFTADVTELADGDDITFTIDGQSATIPGSTTVDADIDGETITIDGVNYLIDASTPASTTLTAQSDGAVAGDVTITDQSAGSVTGTQTTTGVDPTGALGSDSVTDGVNTVNAGAGDDVIVLSSSDTTIDTVEFDAGGFGNDTIAHFNAGAGGDVLDFTAWLDNATSASNSADSEVRVDTTIQTGVSTSISENSVTIANFDDLAIGGNATFADMTDQQVIDALNDNFGAAAPDGDLVGNIQKSILLVQNNDGDGNLGEYKAYEVSYDTSSGTDEFVGASLVGSVDFGEDLNATFDVANFA